jgi:hypothetical protein
MAPHLATSQHDLIRDMIVDGTLTAAQMAAVAVCSKLSVKAIRSNLCHFNTTKAPANGGGRRRSITPPMLDALREHLLEKPGLYQEEMALFLWDEFGVHISTHAARIHSWCSPARLARSAGSHRAGLNGHYKKA